MIEQGISTDIVGLYGENYMDMISINEIAKRLGRKYPQVHQKVQDLVREEVIRTIDVGRSRLCMLNLTHPLALYLVSFYQIRRRMELQLSEFDQVRDEVIRKYAPSMILIEGKRVQDVYMVTSASVKPVTIGNIKLIRIDEKEMLEKMKEKKFFTTCVVLFGIEHFINFIVRHKEEVGRVHNPLLGRLL